MPRRSLKPQLNQIRAWVHQGRTDAWIAHQLEISRDRAARVPQAVRTLALTTRTPAPATSTCATRSKRRSKPPPPRRRPRRPSPRTRTATRIGEGCRARAPAATAQTPSPSRSSRRPRPPQGARGDLRPRRRRGLRPLARRLGQGQPRLRRALGRQPRRHRPDRVRPDRHPPRRLPRRRRVDDDSEDSDSDSADLAGCAAGEVAGAAQVDPEGRVGKDCGRRPPPPAPRRSRSAGPVGPLP